MLPQESTSPQEVVMTSSKIKTPGFLKKIFFQFLEFLLNLLNIENCLCLLPRLSFSHCGALESSHVEGKQFLSEFSLLIASPSLPAGEDPITNLDPTISSTVNPHFPLSLQPAAANIEPSKPSHFFFLPASGKSLGFYPERNTKFPQEDRTVVPFNRQEH